jgi:hypothetical protein
MLETLAFVDGTAFRANLVGALEILTEQRRLSTGGLLRVGVVRFGLPSAERSWIAALVTRSGRRCVRSTLA